VRLFEGTRAAALHDVGARGAVEVAAAGGRVRARRVLLATSAFPPVLRAIRRYVVPVYDYALVTEPLDAAQREAVGWHRRQGRSDGANQFHYYRLTPDDGILFGGYDAVYRFRGPVGPEHDEESTRSRACRRTSSTPSRSFAACRSRIAGRRDRHGEPLLVFFGTAHAGRVAYARLGVGATRFGARVALDLLDGRRGVWLRTLDRLGLGFDSWFAG
jgi:glycine/D-amino acid oxidase-like deaminating enzyme